MRMRSTLSIVAASVLALAHLCAVASWAGDAPAAPPASPVSARASPADVTKFLAGWAEAAGAGMDAATGYPERVTRTKDGAAMVLVPAGTFQMGAVPGDTDAYEGENPRHAVTLTKAYYMDESEATNDQFERFATATGHKTKSEKGGRAVIADGVGNMNPVDGASWRAPLPGGKQQTDWKRHPVVLVSWHDAKAFADWVGAALPTEAQFERALRGGEEGKKYPWGDQLPPPAKSGNLLDAAARRTFPRWTFTIDGYDDGYARTAPVKSFPANAFGLYDLNGNVREWCADGERRYEDKAATDPVGAVGPDARRALRGGSWYLGFDIGLRTSWRVSGMPTDVESSLGFRCAKTLP